MRYPLVSLIALLLLGCSSTPERIRQAPPGAPTLTEVRQQPETHLGARVRWGGTIARVDNRQDETRLEVVLRPLYGDGEPKELDRSEGRFIARLDGFLDPAIYASGRRITVLGKVGGTLEQELGQMRYRYPLVEVETHYLWPQTLERETAPHYYDPWYYDPWYPWHPYPWHRHPYY